jgi:acylphosphatase
MLPPLKRHRSGLSSVISSVVLSAAVLVVGGIVWNYANGASSVMAAQYHNESMNLVKELRERYMIEHITNNETHIMAWVYNYGDVDVELVVYANHNTSVGRWVNSTDQVNPIVVQSKSSFQAVIDCRRANAPPISDAIYGGDIIGVNIYSRRQNNVYYSYISK